VDRVERMFCVRPKVGFAFYVFFQVLSRIPPIFRGPSWLSRQKCYISHWSSSSQLDKPPSSFFISLSLSSACVRSGHQPPCFPPLLAPRLPNVQSDGAPMRPLQVVVAALLRPVSRVFIYIFCSLPSETYHSEKRFFYIFRKSSPSVKYVIRQSLHLLF
jgi:hypothetical protein